jgi:hypothetical protein
MKGARAIILLVLIGSVVSAGLAYKKFALDRDYFVYANVPCDPAAHSCFVGDGDDTPSFYEKVSKKAYLIPACDGWAGQCPVLSCSPSDGMNCAEEFCSTGGADACSGDAPQPSATSTDGQ